ncbi:MAG: hypothetical protein JWQ27_2252 [Ferruginibacter sp.]|nr:hypothetical protein [Ferruginibacter sp.]
MPRLTILFTDNAGMFAEPDSVWAFGYNPGAAREPTPAGDNVLQLVRHHLKQH